MMNKFITLVFCLTLSVGCEVETKNRPSEPLLPAYQAQSLGKSIRTLGPDSSYLLTPLINEVARKINSHIDITEFEAEKVLDDISSLIGSDVKKVFQGKKVADKISALRKYLEQRKAKKGLSKPRPSHLNNPGCTSCGGRPQPAKPKPKPVPKPSPDEVHEKRFVGKKNIIFHPGTSPNQPLNVVGSLTEGLRILTGSMPFHQKESLKRINFKIPFHTPPVVMISVRYKDVTFATPVVSDLSVKGFTVRGLSLPPPATNAAVIDYVAIGR